MLNRGGQGRPHREGEIGTKAQDGLKEARELAPETAAGGIFQAERSLREGSEGKERKHDKSFSFFFMFVLK